MTRAASDGQFIVLSLPRSRSAWLAKFLSYKEWYCGHDQLRYMRSLDDAKVWLTQEKTGSCETAVAPYWRLLSKYAPNIKIVTVRRPVEEAVESLRVAGISHDPSIVLDVMTNLDRKLDQIEGRLPNVLSVRYDDLRQEEVCAKIFQFCLPYEHDHSWWEAADRTNVQINFLAMMRYANAHLADLTKLVAQARQAMLVDMSSKPVDTQGVEIKEESFESFRRECQHLFRQHCLIVGEHPDNWMHKNIPMMRKLYDLGAMQIMVGRCNGKPFGYLMTFLCPSLEAENRTSAQHATFYADKAVPGLGLKLQRAANAALKEKGVYEVFMRAGVRGDGDRMDTLYKRVGAQEFGEMYRLSMVN